MHLLPALLVIAIPAALSVVVAATPLGGHLRPRMSLVYQSEGTAQPPWSVDSIALGVEGMPGAECVTVQLRRTADPAPAERYCAAHDTLFRWSDRSVRWDISRPIGRSMTWQSVRPNRDTVRYDTHEQATEKIGTLTIDVIHTTVTTVDSLGRPKTRLRERYAPGLLTATGGVFEAPDSAAAGRWVARRSFELKEIRPPVP